MKIIHYKCISCLKFFIYWFKLINTLYEIFGFLKTINYKCINSLKFFIYWLKLFNTLYEIFGFLQKEFLFFV